MDTSEVLKQIEGLSKRELYYWEEIRLISPKRIKRGKVEFREYSKKDLEKIQMLYKYVQQGFTPKVAYQKADDENNKAKIKIGQEGGQCEFTIGVLKLDSLKIQRVSEKAFSVLSKLEFDSVIPVGLISLMIVGGLSSIWRSKMNSTFQIMTLGEENKDGDSHRKKTVIMIHDGILTSNIMDDNSFSNFYKNLIAIEKSFQSRNIILAKTLIVLPDSLGSGMYINPEVPVNMKVEHLFKSEDLENYFGIKEFTSEPFLYETIG